MISDEINALPEEVRAYIHHLETECDPQGTLRRNWELEQENKQLRALLEEIRAVVKAK